MIEFSFGIQWRPDSARSLKKIFHLLILFTLASCAPDTKTEPTTWIAPNPSDIKYYLEENPNATPEDARKELEHRAKWAQAALNAGLDKDPVVRAEFARVLASRLRETQLFPKLKEAAATPIPESRLREIYEEGKDRYNSAEKRQAAVLWLNPGQDPARAKAYAEKLNGAREWFVKNGIPTEEGFAVLSIDHSEHAPSRYKGGVVGWFPQDGGTSTWEKSLVSIVYGLNEIGDVSPVIENGDGIFLVRYMGAVPSVERSFEDVSPEIEREERRRIDASIEAEFEKSIEDRHL